jgi:hypothetical protein
MEWRQGIKGPLRASFAAARVRVADGAPTRTGIRSQHLPNEEEVWLIGERRSHLLCRNRPHVRNRPLAPRGATGQVSPTWGRRPSECAGCQGPTPSTSLE